MSVGTTHRLYLIGTSPEDAVKNSDAHFSEKSAQEDAVTGENIYAIDVTLFASRLKPVEKWD
jgi:hypothetical protein